MSFPRKTILFTIGGGAYTGLELLWRGRTHGSMFLAGGASFLLLGKLGKHSSRLSLPTTALAATGIITSVEYAAGLLFNRNYHIWDYRELPLNYRGQVCLPYSLLWLPLGLFAMEFYKLLDGAFPDKKKIG